MAVLTSVEAAKRFRAAAKALRPACRRALREAATQTRQAAREHSLGPYSLATLAAMGHPYAKRAPNPPMHPSIINYHRGEYPGGGAFYRGWHTVSPVWTGQSLVAWVRNDVPHAPYLANGTDKMIRRPLPARLVVLMRPVLADLVKAAVKDALSALD